MGYPFSNTERTLYRKTFLKDVHLCISFADVTAIDMGVLLPFFCRHFNLNLNSFQDVSVNSEDGLVCVDFSSSFITIKLKHPAYITYPDLQKWLPILKEYLTLLRVERLSKIVFSKYNELEYELPEGASLDVTEIIKQVFSDKIIAYHERPLQEVKENEDQTARWEVCGEFRGEDELNSVLRYEFGYSRKGIDRNKGCLTLKLSASTESLVFHNSLDLCLDSLNLIIDSAFVWSVNSEILDMMTAQ